MIFLHLEAFENKLFELDSSIIQKVGFYGQTLLGKWLFARLGHVFRDSCSFPHTRNFWKYQTILSKKSDMSQQP